MDRTREPTSLKHIVFPVDFSDRSNGAVTFVAEMVRKQDAKVTLIAAAHLPDMELQETSTIDPQPIFDGLKSQLDRAYLSYFAGLNVDRLPGTTVKPALSKPGLGSSLTRLHN